jgi:predicted AlkP superfamily phosphohydrolase/phosphomutase
MGITVEKRVLVIGMDAATFDLIDPLVARGDLPHLAQLLQKGSRRPLLSTIQPTTAPAWTTFLTGVNQGKHGLYDFVQRRPDSYNMEVTNASHVRAPSILELAGRQGRRVIALNIPYTSPPPAVNGVIVGGPFAPIFTRQLVKPEHYFDTIQELAPDYFILPDFNAQTADPMGTYANRLLQGIALRESVALHLLDAEPWDLFAVVFMATDEGQHTFWHCLDAEEGSEAARYRHVIPDIYRRIDEAIGKIVAQIAADDSHRETVVVILSDHGAGPFHWMINLNRWLADAGYLHFEESGGAAGLTRLKVNLVKQTASLYRRRVPAPLRAQIRNRLGIKRFEQMKGEFESLLMTANVAWEKTRAYSMGAGGNIYVNLRGREPLGIVAAGAEYEQVRETVAAALLQMRDPDTGEPMVRHVHRREALYAGPYLEQAPDLVVEWSNYGYWGRGQYDSQAPVFQRQRKMDFSAQPLTGSHRPEGILIASGPGVRAGATQPAARLTDLAPTILALLGVPVPANLDGRLLADLFTEEQAALLARTAAEAAVAASEESGEAVDYTAEEMEAIAEHLRSLGYL